MYLANTSGKMFKTHCRKSRPVRSAVGCQHIRLCTARKGKIIMMYEYDNTPCNDMKDNYVCNVPAVMTIINGKGRIPANCIFANCTYLFNL